MAKKLFVLISDGGDGSYHPYYTFNETWIKQMEERSRTNWDEMCVCPSIRATRAGVHYDVLMVPDECTLESLGIYSDCANRIC